MLRVFVFLICVSLFCSGCKKDEGPLPVTYDNMEGIWNLTSNVFNSTEYFNTFYEYSTSELETSCGNTVYYTSYHQVLEIKLMIENSKCWDERLIVTKSPDFDSTYASCELQCCTYDTTLYEGSPQYPNGFAISNDKKTCSITYIWQTTIGGYPLYNTQEFSILQLTDHTLQIVGEGPYFLSIMNYGTSTYTFSR